LSSCRVEACAATLRHLGTTRFAGVAYDEARIFWVEDHTVRSVALLPTP
jgi:hypothetical protein